MKFRFAPTQRVQVSYDFAPTYARDIDGVPVDEGNIRMNSMGFVVSSSEKFVYVQQDTLVEYFCHVCFEDGNFLYVAERNLKPVG
jgi:hypothetical protein